MSLRKLFMPLVLLGLSAAGQDAIHGVVRDAESGELLPTANVTWLGTTVGCTADADGHFRIDPPPAWPAELQVSFVGYATARIPLSAPPSDVLQVGLRWAVEMGPVEVIERQSTTQLQTRTLISTETIGQGELKRAACCDLSESFETNATVDVSFNDAISGTKTIRMLGLDGKYAQMSVENIPFIRGLSIASGLTLIPGTWINEINLSKGIGTAVNGPNAMTGQIDLCLLQPAAEGPLFVNAYGNSQGRTELNVHSAQRTGAHSDNLLMVHGNWFNTEMDQNSDGFMDMPLSRRINVLDRWIYRNDRRSGQVTMRVVRDERDGGQSAAHGAMPAPPDHVGPHPEQLYTIGIDNTMADLMAKYGFVFANDPTKSIGFIASARWHDVASIYGLRTYSGEQRSVYGNAVYQQLLGTGTDQIKTGLSFQYDEYAESFNASALAGPDSLYGRVESMPGAFVEYTRKRDRLTLVAGVRGDLNSRFGNTLGPRAHLKYDLGPLTSARASVGHAFRTALPLVENASVLASSRRVTVEGDLGMERAWNMGVSLLHKFKWVDRKWAVGVDAYSTQFTTQVVTDLDRSPQAVVFYMLNGRSYANSLLADVQVQLTRVLDLKMSYRWFDVRTTYDGRLLERPFTPAHRGLIDLGFHDRKERWRADVSLNIFGEGRLPSTASNPEAYRFIERSPSFATLHAQITHITGPWEFYVGGENLTSTLQQQQIIAPEDPYGPYFDATLIWGPTNLAMIYGGLRYNLPRRTTTDPH
ncbi:MAG: TonB-dependent receptor [Flavobacteriales bacterium]|nr:TonB-dependent receptor [Flavobacteriales bacterium]